MQEFLANVITGYDANCLSTFDCVDFEKLERLGVDPYVVWRYCRTQTMISSINARCANLNLPFLPWQLALSQLITEGFSEVINIYRGNVFDESGGLKEELKPILEDDLMGLIKLLDNDLAVILANADMEASTYDVNARENIITWNSFDALRVEIAEGIKR